MQDVDRRMVIAALHEPGSSDPIGDVVMLAGRDERAHGMLDALDLPLDRTAAMSQDPAADAARSVIRKSLKRDLQSLAQRTLTAQQDVVLIEADYDSGEAITVIFAKGDDRLRLISYWNQQATDTKPVA